MLYLTVTFLVISCLASVVVLAALMRSAQITRQLEQHGIQSEHHARNVASSGLHGGTVHGHHLKTEIGMKL